MTYSDLLQKKSQLGGFYGFDPIFMPEAAFDFQKSLIEWNTKKGRSATFADCGLGKSLIELSFAQNVVQKTNGNVLLLTPIAVGVQMQKEAEKFGIEASRSRDGKIKSKITISNYEMLHLFDPSDFEALVCDESSILKNFNGKYKQAVTIFARKMKYRLLATATAAPNDFIELGTSSEALGYLGYMDMLSKFFINDLNNSAMRYRGEEVKWRLKGHAYEHFWKWVASWARALRSPSDLGFENDGYILPPLVETDIELRDLDCAPDGYLFSIPANGLKEQRDERRNTVKHRCEDAARRAMAVNDYSVTWCNLNQEGDLLEKLIPGAVQISGKDSDDAKEEKLVAFSEGKIKRLITKPKIGAFGLNWQHCNYTIFFPTHSYEQYYQVVRRFWRFGQKRQVNIDLIFTEGDVNMLANLKRKQRQASEMFDKLVQYMNDAIHISGERSFTKSTEVPGWL